MKQLQNTKSELNYFERKKGQLLQKSLFPLLEKIELILTPKLQEQMTAQKMMEIEESDFNFNDSTFFPFSSIPIATKTFLTISNPINFAVAFMLDSAS